MSAGRPTKYSKDILDKAVEYVLLFSEEETMPKDEIIPSIEGLALYLEVARSTIYDWAKEDDKKEFSYIVEKLLSRQGLILLNGTLTNKLNSSVGKAILSKHGYAEKTEQVTTHSFDDKTKEKAKGLIGEYLEANRK